MKACINTPHERAQQHAKPAPESNILEPVLALLGQGWSTAGGSGKAVALDTIHAPFAQHQPQKGQHPCAQAVPRQLDGVACLLHALHTRAHEPVHCTIVGCRGEVACKTVRSSLRPCIQLMGCSASCIPYGGAAGAQQTAVICKQACLSACLMPFCEYRGLGSC